MRSYFAQRLLFTWTLIILSCFISKPTFADGDESSTATLGSFNKNCDTFKNAVLPPPPIPPFTWKHTALVTIWFDDGWLTQYTAAFPLMEKYGFKGAIAVAIKFVCYSAFMTWDELRTIQANGWETTAHSVSHSCDLGFYTTAKTKYELTESKRIIEAHGLRADQFVMPCGFSRAQIASHFIDKYPPIVEMTKQYYQSYRTTTSVRSNTLPLLDPYNLKAFQLRNTTTDKEIEDALKKAEKEKTWLIFVFHQIDDSKQLFAISPARFEKILAMIKASHLPVILPSQGVELKNTL
jgi:peptidoglycan/xylan/chitin deacetylase (PgdA/CDA1 family)